MRCPQRREAADLNPPGIRGSGSGIPDWPIGITISTDTVERRHAEGFNVVMVGFGDGGITPESARTLAIGRTASGRP